MPTADNKSLTLHLFSRWDQTNITNSSADASDSLTKGEFLFYDTKALFVQILRLNPSWLSLEPFDLKKIMVMCGDSKDKALVLKGVKLIDMMDELEALKRIDPLNNYASLVEEIAGEMNHLGDLREKAVKEHNSLQAVFQVIMEHNDYLKAQLDTYRSYLQNVRVKSSATDFSTKPKGPARFTHQKLEQEGVIIETNVPESR